MPPAARKRQRTTPAVSPVTVRIDYRLREKVPWDDRLNALDPEMVKCRANRRHDWKHVGDDVIAKYPDGTVRVFRHRLRCGEGCLTAKSYVINTDTWEIEGSVSYEWDPRYKISGDPINPAALRREQHIHANPTLFAHLLNGNTAEQ